MLAFFLTTRNQNAFKNFDATLKIIFGQQNFKTNAGRLEMAYNDRLYGAAGFTFQRGEPLGGFDLGSSIVLIFSAPGDMKFHIDVGQKIKFGEPVATFQFDDSGREMANKDP